MNKKLRKLIINKETLRNLDELTLQKAAVAGDEHTGPPASCGGTVCVCDPTLNPCSRLGNCTGDC